MKSENELTRRNFLKGGAAGLVALAFPSIVTASNLMPIDSKAKALVKEPNNPFWIDWVNKEIKYNQAYKESLTVKQLYEYLRWEMSQETGMSFPTPAKMEGNLMIIDPQYTISHEACMHLYDGSVIETATDTYWSAVMKELI